MPLVVPKPKASEVEYEMPEAGTYPARCISIVDLGEQTTNYNGEEKTARKVRFAWELVGELDSRGRPFVVSKRYTLSLHEKAALRKDLENWRGKGFTEAELAAFDLEALIKAPAILTIQHRAVGDKTYANVTAVARPMKGMTIPNAESDTLLFSLDDPHNLDAVPAWLQNQINFPARAAPVNRVETTQRVETTPRSRPVAVSVAVATGADDMDDDIPF